MASSLSITIDKSPRWLLLATFLAWKLLLLTIAILCPEPGYDTSTQLLFKGHGIRAVDSSHLDAHPSPSSPSPLPGHAPPLQGLPVLVKRLLQALTRWDAIYFASVAERGYVYEQEWAFGWGFTKLLSWLGTNLPIATTKLESLLIHGIILAIGSHLISVLLLYQLVLALQPQASDQKTTKSLVFIAATLHILAPAGICLVAPYTEAPFSLLTFTGNLLYVYSWGDTTSKRHAPVQDVYLILSGLCYGLSATIRGNGLLSGIILFHDAVIWFGARAEEKLGFRILTFARMRPELQAQMRSFPFRRLPATIIAGILVGVGFTGPQYIAYRHFCGSDVAERRPWCDKFPPSIYSWVQSHYWNVGFLRYWTLSNLPLFLIAMPVLYVMISSSWKALNGNTKLASISSTAPNSSKKKTKSAASSPQDLGTDALLVRLALPQLALASAAFTSFHVQVITRLSSGYPVWYMVLARDVFDGKRETQWLVRWMIMYALIQAVLFCSFLPPA